MYICEICHEHNHAARFHCKACGTIPAHYSVLRKPVAVNSESILVEVCAAYGCQRQDYGRTVRFNLQTVSLDTYAEN